MKTWLLFSIFLMSVILSHGQSWMYTNLTEAKLQMGATSLGTKAYFAGGANGNVYFSLVEIYDVVEESWSYGNLSIARSFPVGVSCGSKVFFAGGTTYGSNFYDIVDIYDTLTQEWTVEHLSVPRFSISAVAHHQSNKVLFAGGLDLSNFTAIDVVDIYDVQTGEWDTASLSMARGLMSSAVVGDLAIFAGGYDFQEYTDRVDIYNFVTETWTTDTLSLPRAATSAAVAGNNVLIAGGMTDPNDPNSASNNMDIYDNSSGTWTVGILPHARAFFESAPTIGDKVYFAGGGNFYAAGGTWTTSTNIIDIYDESIGTWSFDNLSHDLAIHSVTSVETPIAGYLLVAGGKSYEQDSIFSKVEIFWDPVGVEEVVSRQSLVVSYPNPFTNFTTLEYKLDYSANVNLTIYNHLGQRVAVLADGKQAAGKQQVRWDAEGMPAGVYYFRLTTDDRRLTTNSGKIVKK